MPHFKRVRVVWVAERYNSVTKAQEEEMGLNLAALHECYDDVPIGFTVIELMLDDAGQPVDWIFRYLNVELARIEMLEPDKLLGRYFYRDVFPNLNAKKWLDFYYRSAFLGETLELHEYSPEIAKYLKIKCFPWKEQGYCGCVLVEETEERCMFYRLEHLSKLAHYDMATEVQNRNSYQNYCAHFAECNGGARVEHVPTTCAVGSTVGVVFVDVNGLKNINDHFGHDSGTFLIRMVSDKIKQVYGDSNHQLFRIGGDEFVVVLPGISHDLLLRTEQRLKDALVNATIPHFPSVLAAVGSAWQECAQSLEQVVAVADQRMYEHKRQLKAQRAP